MKLNEITETYKIKGNKITISCLTDITIAFIIDNSEFGTDFRKVSVEVAKEILKRFGE